MWVISGVRRQQLYQRLSAKITRQKWQTEKIINKAVKEQSLHYIKACKVPTPNTIHVHVLIWIYVLWQSGLVWYSNSFIYPSLFWHYGKNQIIVVHACPHVIKSLMKVLEKANVKHINLLEYR